MKIIYSKMQFANFASFQMKYLKYLTLITFLAFVLNQCPVYAGWGSKLKSSYDKLRHRPVGYIGGKVFGPVAQGTITPAINESVDYFFKNADQRTNKLDTVLDQKVDKLLHGLDSQRTLFIKGIENARKGFTKDLNSLKDSLNSLLEQKIGLLQGILTEQVNSLKTILNISTHKLKVENTILASNFWRTGTYISLLLSIFIILIVVFYKLFPTNIVNTKMSFLVSKLLKIKSFLIIMFGLLIGITILMLILNPYNREIKTNIERETKLKIAALNDLRIRNFYDHSNILNNWSSNRLLDGNQLEIDDSIGRFILTYLTGISKINNPNYNNLARLSKLDLNIFTIYFHHIMELDSIKQSDYLNSSLFNDNNIIYNLKNKYFEFKPLLAIFMYNYLSSSLSINDDRRQTLFSIYNSIRTDLVKNYGSKNYTGELFTYHINFDKIVMTNEKLSLDFYKLLDKDNIDTSKAGQILLSYSKLFKELRKETIVNDAVLEINLGLINTLLLYKFNTAKVCNCEFENVDWNKIYSKASSELPDLYPANVKNTKYNPLYFLFNDFVDKRKINKFNLWDKFQVLINLENAVNEKDRFYSFCTKKTNC